MICQPRCRCHGAMGAKICFERSYLRVSTDQLMGCWVSVYIDLSGFMQHAVGSASFLPVSLYPCHGFWSPWFDSSQFSPNTLSKGRDPVMQYRLQMDATCGTHMGMSQNEVSVFPLKVAILEPITDTSFWDISICVCFNRPSVGIYCLRVAGAVEYGCISEIPSGRVILWSRECWGSMEASNCCQLVAVV